EAEGRRRHIADRVRAPRGREDPERPAHGTAEVITGTEAEGLQVVIRILREAEGEAAVEMLLLLDVGRLHRNNVIVSDVLVLAIERGVAEAVARRRDGLSGRAQLRLHAV